MGQQSRTLAVWQRVQVQCPAPTRGSQSPVILVLDPDPKPLSGLCRRQSPTRCTHKHAGKTLLWIIRNSEKKIIYFKDKENVKEKVIPSACSFDQNTGVSVHITTAEGGARGKRQQCGSSHSGPSLGS